MRKKFLFSAMLLLLAGCLPDIPTTGSISGTVTDETTMQPLEGCTVTLMPGGTSITTGIDGSFRFKDIAPDAYSVEVARTGYLPNKKSVNVTVGNTSSADIALSKYGAIHGVVKDKETSQPVQGCTVTLLLAGEGGRSITTGTDGTFLFDDLAPNSYGIDVVRSGYVSENKRNISVTSGSTVAADIVLSKTSSMYGSITGIIKDVQTSQPLENCVVTLILGGQSVTSKTTGTDGIFQFPDLAPNVYNLTVIRGGYQNGSRTNVSVTAGNATPVDITLSKTSGSIYGFIKDAETLQPLAGCTVTLLPGGTTKTTIADGAYQFDNVSPNIYEVGVVRSGYLSDKRNVTVMTGGSMQADFVLAKNEVNNTPPTMGSVLAKSITHNSVELESTVIDIGSSSVTERGFIYSEYPNPTVTTGIKVTVAGGSGIFSQVVSDLKENTTYYVVAYAINSRGTGWSEQTFFTTTSAPAIGTVDNVIYVSPSGNDANNGSSWSRAKKSIAAAVNAASEGMQIWVSGSEYREAIRPKDGVNIYGGFSGNESSIAGRSQKTIVMGLVCPHFSQPTVVNGFTISAATDSLRNHAVVENCLFTGKYIMGTSNTGTIYVAYSTDEDNLGTYVGSIIKNCIIEEGMSVDISSSKLKMINSHIRGCSSSEGSIWTYSGNLEMYSCVITNNSYGIYISNYRYSSSIKLYNCTIASNEYGFYCYSSYNNIELYNCLIWNNSVDRDAKLSLSSCIQVETNDNTAVKFKKPSTRKGASATDWQTADWSITAGSSCIDAGVNLYYPVDEYPTDIAGNPRIKGSSIDIGAYEY
ncbi:hypothetical protein FACS1894181_06000 [Bacteroidia bacterium]|nr:hypothetical protein FACS1894181_06000 [Bacteroidia bacterium]